MFAKSTSSGESSPKLAWITGLLRANWVRGTATILMVTALVGPAHFANTGTRVGYVPVVAHVVSTDSNAGQSLARRDVDRFKLLCPKSTHAVVRAYVRTRHPRTQTTGQSQNSVTLRAARARPGSHWTWSVRAKLPSGASAQGSGERTANRLGTWRSSTLGVAAERWRLVARATVDGQMCRLAVPIRLGRAHKT